MGVVNLRNPGEPDQPMSPTEEGEKVRALGMEYLHYGVGSAPLTEQGVTAVSDFVDRHAQGAQKVLVHCRRGPRVAALLLLQQARANKWTAAETIAKGKAMGLDVEGGLKMMVESLPSGARQLLIEWETGRDFGAPISGRVRRLDGAERTLL